MPYCNDADSGYAAARKGADFRQVADHEKDYERFCRRQHGQTMVRPLTALRTGDRKPNPYREVGGFSVGGCFTAPYTLREPCAGKLARTVLRGRGSSNTPLLPDTQGATGS